MAISEKISQKPTKKIELLAPAGSFESLKAAISNGADAVYLGGGKLNARVNAANFTEDELIKALDYAHERGIKIYVTLNTLIKNQELSDAVKFAEFVYKHGADAVIVQDMGLTSLLKKNLPGLDIHASTQMTLANSKAIKTMESMGVNRVVLPRELALKEIEYIKGQTSAQLEVFVHGALCVCYSGQCMMSSFIGGRSGNRGLCAQPCRLPWSLSNNGAAYSDKSYLLSPKDLMTIELLPQVKNAGVLSLKLEGRMKSAEYVAIVTSIYRKYIDMLESLPQKEYTVDQADKDTLMQAFNRGGFTRGYLEGNRNYKKLIYPNHPKNQGVLLGEVIDKNPLYVKLRLKRTLDMGDGIEIRGTDSEVHSFIVTSILDNAERVRTAKPGKEVWVGDIKTAVKSGSVAYKTLSKHLFSQARRSFEHKEVPVIPLNMEFSIKTGEPALLKVSDSKGNTVLAESNQIAQKAINLPLLDERIKEQLSKTGDTPYFLGNLLINSDNNSTMPISALNAIRREALDKMKSLRIRARKKTSVNLVDYDSGFMRSYNDKTQDIKDNLNDDKQLLISAFFHTVPDSTDELNGFISRIYLPITNPDTINKIKAEFDGEIFIWTPIVLKDSELIGVIKQLKDIYSLIDGIAYGNLGAYKAIKEEYSSIALCAEPSMNIFNNESIALHENLGATTVVLSPELNLKEVSAIDSNVDLEVIVYGRAALMTMEHCPSSLEMVCTQNCNDCEGNHGFLKDRKSEVFAFVRSCDLKRTQIFNAHPTFMDDIDALKKTPINYLRLTFTNENKYTRKAIAKYYFDRIKGKKGFDSEIKEAIDQIKDGGFTKGHWFRGVD